MNSTPRMDKLSFPDVPMIDARERVMGTLDLTINRTMPGMAHATVVRSPVPHARITAIHTSEAERTPGVIAVLTGASLQGLGIELYYGGLRNDQPVLAIDRVRYEGEPVVLVVAGTEADAAEAASLVDVDYDELPFVTDARDAMTPGAPVLHERWPDNDSGTWKLRRGDIEQGWRKSEKIYEGVFTSPPA